MTKVKFELTYTEAISVSSAVGEYFRELEKRAKTIHPSHKLEKQIVKDSILELGTAYTKIEEAIRNSVHE